MLIGHLHSNIQDNRVLDNFNAILIRTDFETWDYCKKHNVDFLNCFYGQYSTRAKLRELIYPNIKYKHWLTIVSQYDFVFLSANADIYPDSLDFRKYVKEMVNLFKPDVVGAMNEVFEKRGSAEKVVRTTWDTKMGILNSVNPNIEVCSWNEKIRTSEEKKAFEEVLNNQQHKSVCKYVGYQSLETEPEIARQFIRLAQVKGYEVIDVELMTTTYRFSEIKMKFENNQLLGVDKVFIGCPYVSEQLADYDDMFNKYALSIGDFYKDKYGIIQYVQQFKSFTNGEQEEVMNKMLDEAIMGTIYKQGTKGYIPKLIQKVLNTYLKYWEKELLVEDGLFGSKTKEVVKEFQAYRDLKADGIVGRNTMRELILYFLEG